MQSSAPTAAKPALRPYLEYKKLLGFGPSYDDTFIYNSENNDGKTPPKAIKDKLTIPTKSIKITEDFFFKITSTDPKYQAFLEKKVYFADNGALVDFWDYFTDLVVEQTENNKNYDNYVMKPTLPNVFKEENWIGKESGEIISKIIKQVTTKKDGKNTSRPIIYCDNCKYEHYRKVFIDDNLFNVNDDGSEKHKLIVKENLTDKNKILKKLADNFQDDIKTDRSFLIGVYEIIGQLTSAQVDECLNDPRLNDQTLKEYERIIQIFDIIDRKISFETVGINVYNIEGFTSDHIYDVCRMIKELLENKQKIFKILYPTTTGGKKRKSIKRKQTRSAKKSNRRKTKKHKRKN